MFAQRQEYVHLNLNFEFALDLTQFETIETF